MHCYLGALLILTETAPPRVSQLLDKKGLTCKGAFLFKPASPEPTPQNPALSLGDAVSLV